MSEYIEREALKYETWTTWPLCKQITVVRKKTIESIPAADVAPVRHDRLEEIINPYGELEGWICKCGRESSAKENYCPNCDAKMDQEEQT